MNEKTKEKVKHCISVLNENNLKELHICNFGTYRQYELAGEFITINVLDDSSSTCTKCDGELELECDGGDYMECDACEGSGFEYLDEELHEKLYKELKFINKTFIKALGLYDSGQNELWLTKDGFESRLFTI